MSDLLGGVAELIADPESGKLPEYYYFEPWDVEKRPDSVLAQAVSDGIDLASDEIRKHIGADPHEFQRGYLMSTAFMRALLAATQIGKSICARVEAITITTGEAPISMRYDQGVVTRVKRLITPANIRRFGRFDSSSGKFIDRRIVPQPEGWEEWNCGYIVGCGKFPEQKIAAPGDEVWIGTWQRALNVYWWPGLGDDHTRLIPKHLIDGNRGVNGVDVETHTIYTVRDCCIRIITYESGYQRFEARKVQEGIMDEEPIDERIFQALQTHCRLLSLTMTPYNGLTYTKKILFPDEPSPQCKVFHATMYDSPYQDLASVNQQRRAMKPWHIAARVWGMYAEATGEPFFDREKLNAWLSRYNMAPKLCVLVPSSPFISVAPLPYAPSDAKSLIDVSVSSIAADKDNARNVWRVWEAPQPGVRYLLTADPAEGSENAEDAADYCAATVWKVPAQEAQDKTPKLVASIRSTLETIEFSRVCLLAARWYNNALLAGETRRAACNAAFFAEAKDWPNWFFMSSINDATQKPQRKKGFDTNAATRSSVFELVSAWINEYGESDYPNIPDKDLLKELSACVVGKKGRPDHPKSGSLDLAICFGIALYVFKNSPDQLEYQLPYTEEQLQESWLQKMFGESNPNSQYLGANMPEWR